MPLDPRIGVLMGSRSDYDVMRHAGLVLKELDIAFEERIVSAHRTPNLLFDYAESAMLRGIRIIIAGAGGAAHLPGMLAAKTLLPVFGVPIPATSLNGLDSLLSIVQMPRGVPVGTLAIGRSGAVNAALLSAQVLALHDEQLQMRLKAWRAQQENAVLQEVLPA